ncbi:hypothetical protein SAPIO_CDS2233 [Scedosporium apiospermum]|uniref:GPI inositol-deacylase winged helix domain-containing protein n=1 Tax=Pseudallescheria apiosperma TaxID=563466 RepID=A0A084GC32_PSEDA|nr:uncharacterized protein SAPIO_CDS2233 [Scedosporium apiospermum]KEZ44894.1 hypothetical protein SAPIO_CDS2233 [Scedosporium apiospermum]
MEKAEGSFLWANLAVSILLRESTLEPFEIAHRLALLPTDLDAVYETILRRIRDSRDDRLRKAARDALTLVLCAQRPLSILELREALVVTRKLEITQKTQKGDIPRDIAAQLPVLCGGLIEVLPETPTLENSVSGILGQTVTLIHITAKEFLMREASSALVIHWDEGGKADLHFHAALICLSFVNATFEHESYAFPHLPTASKAIASSHFLEYAVLYGLWGENLENINEEDHCGQTPLSFAAAMGHIDLCKALVKLGADVNHRDQIYGQTPLNWAAFHGHDNVVEFLLQAGSDCKNRKSGVSALWIAARGAHRKVVQLLLKAAAKAQTSDERTGESALSQAAALGHIPIVSLLLKSGADIENRDKHGWTPIHHCVSRGRRKTLELLLGTARQDQLQALRVGPVKTQPSWVDTVLRAILLSLCFRKCNQSETPSTGNTTRDAKTWSGPGQNRNSMISNRKRGRHKLDQESDEDDYGEDQAAFNKRSRRTNSDGRRFACPYHRRNAVKYHTGACNGKGFENIYRLKDHSPCVKRERATDYEEGFDAVQLGKLDSDEMRVGQTSGEECWYAIFKMLFPDWPENEDMPSPYQDDQNKVTLPYQSWIEFREGLAGSDIINEIMNYIANGRGEQGVREILERRTEELSSRLGLPPMTSRGQAYNALATNLAVIPQPLSAANSRSRSTTNALPYAAPSLPLSMSANLGETHFQAMVNNPIGDHQGYGQYLPLPDQSHFQGNPIQDHHGSFNPHSTAMSNSGLGTSSVVVGNGEA